MYSTEASHMSFFGDVQYLTEFPWADLIRLSLIKQVRPRQVHLPLRVLFFRTRTQTRDSINITLLVSV